MHVWSPFIFNPKLSLKPIGVALLLGVVAFNRPASAYNVSHGNSSLDVDATGGLGVYNWSVDGVDQISAQRYFYRVGVSGGESTLESISGTPFVTSVGNNVTVTHSNSLYNVKISYTLTGGTAGSGASTLQESITVKNTSGGSLDFHFFQYSDFDLGGVAGLQTALFSTNILGQYAKLEQFGLAGQLTSLVTSGAVPIGSVQADVNNLLLGSLTDGSTTTLNNNYGSGPDDVEFGTQWNMTIANNGTKIISQIQTLAVPEPSSAALLLIGLFGLSWLRRKKSI